MLTLILARYGQLRTVPANTDVTAPAAPANRTDRLASLTAPLSTHLTWGSFLSLTGLSLQSYLAPQQTLAPSLAPTLAPGLAPGLAPALANSLSPLSNQQSVSSNNNTMAYFCPGKTPRFAVENNTNISSEALSFMVANVLLRPPRHPATQSVLSHYIADCCYTTTDTKVYAVLFCLNSPIHKKTKHFLVLV